MIAPVDWTERGRVLGASLTQCHAVVIVGEDPVATAQVALGIARAQAPERHVAIADLIGDAPPLQSLVSSTDPHGIVDSFVFGVSLNRVAHAVADTANLFVMPSGTAPIEPEELFVNPRWKRLSGGFREVGALLLLVAAVDAAKLRDLVDATDGLVIVGDVAPADIPVAQSLAWLRPARGGSTAIAAAAPLATVSAARTKPAPGPQRWFASAAGILLTLSLAAAALWFARRPFAGVRPARAVSATTPSAPVAARMLASDSVRRDSVALAAGVPGAFASDSFPLLPVANAADSAHASGWTVRLEQTNTKSLAILDLRGQFETVPAGTYGFDVRTRSFLLVAGAYPMRAGAESLLVQLRNHKILASDNGSVTSLPFAFLVQADVPVADVPTRLKLFSARGQPVYALRQTDGAANLYFGAYESAQQAALAVPTVREAGLTPTLVYRIGRVF